MINHSGPNKIPANDPGLEDVRAEIERLRRDLVDLGATLRTAAAHEWSEAGARLGAAVAKNRARILEKISAQPEKAAAIAFCCGILGGLVLRGCHRRGGA